MLPDAMRDDEKAPFRMDEEELDEDLLEDGDEAAEDQLLFREALESYRAESLEWAERRSASMPVPNPGAAASWVQRVPRQAFAAAVLVVLVTAAAVRHNSVLTAARQAAPIQQPSAELLASDNLLLDSVSAALDQDVVPTEQELGLTLSPARLIPSHSTSYKRPANDVP